ncbi:MAG: hypothetical protein ACOYON_13755 [Fimbriimonas sp.]
MDGGTLVVLGVIAMVVVMILGAMYSAKKAAERRAALGALAQSLGLDYVAEGLSTAVAGNFWERLAAGPGASSAGQFLARFEGFHPFGQGHTPETCNLIYGDREGINWSIFDYSYKVTTSNGKSVSTTTHPYSIVCARVPVFLPAVRLVPENFLNRIATKFGSQDISVELEEFNRRYIVKSNDSRLCYDLLHPQALEYFMRLPARDWQIAGYQIVLVSPGSISPADYLQMMREIEGFVALIPAYVREDHGFAAKWNSPL